MVELDITDEEKQALVECVETGIRELGPQISNTESYDFREQLKAKREALRKILGQLG
jgi:hypothetical protein